MRKKKIELTASQAELLPEPVAVLGLSLRTTNMLERAGLLTVYDLLMTPAASLLREANVGERTLREIYEALEEYGFRRRSRESH